MIELEDPLPTDSVERRRVQNRNAQRRFRQKRSVNRALASQCPEWPDLLASGTTTPATHDGPLWAAATTVDSDSDPFAASVADVFEAVDLRDVYTSSNNSNNARAVEAFAYSTPDYDAPPTLHSAPASRPIPHRTCSDGILERALASPEMNRRLRSRQQYASATTPETIVGRRSLSIHNRPMKSSSSGHTRLAGGGGSSGTASPASSSRSDDDGLYALHIAAQKGHDRIVRMLLEQNGGIDNTDSDGRTALHLAVMESHDQVVRLLLTHRAHLAIADADGRNSLHWAALRSSEGILRALLAQCMAEPGFDINSADHNGWTALHIAVSSGFEAGVQLLLAHGADINIKARRYPP